VLEDGQSRGDCAARDTQQSIKGYTMHVRDEEVTKGLVVQQWGPAVIVSDGDVVFQPRKIENSGLYEAFESNVLIYIHKEKQLADIEVRYPADHYVMFDDKIRILTAVKEIWGEKLTAVFPKQGHYALDPKVPELYPPADITVERIGDVLNYDLADFIAAAKK
jgi:hypothetical protein